MSNLGPNFYQKLIQICNEVGMKPEHLLQVMSFESGLSPSAINPSSKASGLIQLMDFNLPSLGFKGTSKDFSNLSGEQQLDYIAKFIRDKRKYFNQPFKSAAQYYVGNFFPVALSLPGVRNEDPSTKIVEANPMVYRNKKTGKKLSKKYRDAGVRLDAIQEVNAYKQNPPLHGSTPGAITYGDIQKVLNNQLNESSYKNAVRELEKQNSYIKNNLESVSNYDILIKVKTGDYITDVEFARVLSNNIETNLKCESFIHSDEYDVELKCKLDNFGFKNIGQVLIQTKSLFKDATKKIGGVEANIECFINKKSSIKPIKLSTALSSYRKFLIKFL
jgi:uncharacterized protein (DUF1697 family)